MDEVLFQTYKQISFTKTNNDMFHNLAHVFLSFCPKSPQSEYDVQLLHLAVKDIDNYSQEIHCKKWM